MTDSTAPGNSTQPDGAMTAEDGTPVAVDISRDRVARITWLAFLGGPVTWLTYFMFVYLVAEAGCTGDGHGLGAFDPPVPAISTLVATAVAAIASLATAVWAHRRSRREKNEAGGDHAHGQLAFGGLLLSLLSFLTIVGVGVMAAFFRGC